MDVDVGSSRVLVKDKGAEGLLVPTQFKRKELVVGKMLCLILIEQELPV